TLLMIAHDLAVVEMVADDVAVMRTGELAERGTAATVLSTPSHDYTAALLAARPESAKPGTPLAVLDRETGALRRPAAPEVVPTGSELLLVAARVSVTE